MIELDVQALLSLVSFVRSCTHPERYTSGAAAADATQGDRWCMACGAARVQGQWLVPSWFTPLDKVLAGVPGEPRS